MADNLNPDLKYRLDKIIKELQSSSKLTLASVIKSFVLGLVGALGATVGLTLLLAALGLIIQIFGGTPVIGNVLMHIGRFLHR